MGGPPGAMSGRGSLGGIGASSGSNFLTSFLAVQSILAKDLNLPTSADDRVIVNAVNESIQEMAKEKWKPGLSPKTGRPDPGAFGKELERRVMAKLEKQPGVRPNILSSKQKVWFTNLTIDKNTGEVLEIGTGGKGVYDDKNHIQIDAVKMKPGYKPEVGKRLDPSTIEELYELKANRDGIPDRLQTQKLMRFLNSGAKEGQATRQFKLIHAPKRYVAGQGIVDNSKFTRYVKFYEAIGAVAVLSSTAWALIHYSDYDDELHQVLLPYEKAKNERDRLQQDIYAVEFKNALTRYLEHFGYQENVVDIFMVYKMLGRP
jgi:hypothetical protein